MRRTRTLWMLVLAAVAISMMLGCAAQQQQQGPTPEELAMQRQQVIADSVARVQEQEQEQARQDSVAQVAEMERQRVENERLELQKKQEEERQAKESIEVVYFDFDKSDLKQEARTLLQANAELMRKYSDWQMVIEGHCDERGSTEYNLALGERRANTVKEYYVNYGIDATRFEIISYGEERPAVQGTGEAVWSQNRRAVTVVN